MEIQNLEDIENLEIKSLDEVISESSKPWCYDGWKEIEKQLIESRKAPSLSAWLLYEHQFKKRTVLDISKKLSKGIGSITNMFEKMRLPRRNITETVLLRACKKPPKEELERLYHEEKLSINEIAEMKGVDTSVTQNWFRKYKIKKRNPSEAAKLNIKKHGNPFLGKTHSKETRKKLSELRTKLTNQECTALALDYVLFDDGFEELRKKYRIGEINYYVEKAIDFGAITKEQYREAYKRKMANLNVGLNKGRKASPELKKILSQKHSGKNNAFFGKKHNKDTINLLKSLHETEEAKERDIQHGIKLWKNRKEGKYLLGERLYDSKGEATVGVLLEKYLLGFKLIENKTFQANGDTHCLFDFVLPEAILEWHPINFRYDNELLPQDFQVYKELKNIVKTLDDLRAFKEITRGFKEDLAVTYWMERQEASDNSQIYKGKEVILARNLNELYDDVLYKYGSNFPSKSELRKEFNYLRNQAKLVEPKDKIKDKQMVEAVT